MGILLSCSQISNDNVFIRIIGWAVPFILGLFASFIIDIIRNIIKNRKNRTFIKFYLRDSVLKILPALNSDFETIKQKIEAYAGDGESTISAYEGFNTNILEGISSVDYYSAFKEEFVLLNEIISMIRFLSKNLPDKINNEFYNFIDTHLEEENKVGDKKHVIICNVCKVHKAATLKILECRMKETNLLKLKIEELIK